MRVAHKGSVICGDAGTSLLRLPLLLRLFSPNPRCLHYPPPSNPALDRLQGLKTSTRSQIFTYKAKPAAEVQMTSLTPCPAGQPRPEDPGKGCGCGVDGNQGFCMLSRLGLLHPPVQLLLRHDCLHIACFRTRDRPCLDLPGRVGGTVGSSDGGCQELSRE